MSAALQVTYAEKAARARRRVRRNRVVSIICFVLGATFIAIGVWLLATGFLLGLVNLLNGIVIFGSGLMMRMTANLDEGTARSYESLGRRYGL